MSNHIIDDNLFSQDIIKDNSQRAKNTIMMLYISIVLSFVFIISSYLEFQLLSSGDISTEAAEANDMRQAFIGLLGLVVLIVTAVFFIQWFRRAYNNLHLLGTPLEHSEGWAAGSWFVPILNLFRPYHIMKEIWEKTIANLRKVNQNLTHQIPSNWRTLVSFWWGFWITSSIIENIGFRISMKAETAEMLAAVSVLDIVANLLSIPAAFLIIQIIQKFRPLEEELFEKQAEIKEAF